MSAATSLLAVMSAQLRASRRLEGDIPPQRQNQPSRIDITIVMRSALGTFPTSHCETLQPFRAAEASALGTGLRGEPFVSFDIHRLPSGRLVAQHVPECAPAGVQNGFSHYGFRKLGSIHIADNDQTIFIRQSLAGDMKVMATCVGDLGVDRIDTSFIPSALGVAKRAFILAIVLQGGDFYTVAASGQRLKPEVDADLAISRWKRILNLALERCIPAVARVLYEGPGFEHTFDFSVLPKTNPALEIDNSFPVDAERAGNERYPTQSTLGAEARSEARATAASISRRDKLPTNAVHGIGVQTEICGNSSAKIIEIEGGRPLRDRAKTPALLCLSLGGNAEIPDLITCDRLPAQMLPGNAIFQPKFEGDYAHG